MAEHPKVEKPLLTIPPHASATKIDFSRSPAFGYEGQMFLAASGDYAPITAAAQERSRFYVLSIDPARGEAKRFFRAKKPPSGRRTRSTS